MMFDYNMFNFKIYINIIIMIHLIQLWYMYNFLIFN